jgi:ABC-type amino acid transport system permease subunit
MYQAGLIVSATFLPMPVYTAVALMYFLLVFAVSSAGRANCRASCRWAATSRRKQHAAV